MKNIIKLAGFIALVVVIVFSFANCKEDINLKYSVQVDNQLAAAKAIAASDKVELYILILVYREDAEDRGLFLIADGEGFRNGMVMKQS
jgi:hypothetical protein